MTTMTTDDSSQLPPLTSATAHDDCCAVMILPNEVCGEHDNITKKNAEASPCAPRGRCCTPPRMTSAVPLQENSDGSTRKDDSFPSSATNCTTTTATLTPASTVATIDILGATPRGDSADDAWEMLASPSWNDAVANDVDARPPSPPFVEDSSSSSLPCAQEEACSGCTDDGFADEDAPWRQDLPSTLPKKKKAITFVF